MNWADYVYYDETSPSGLRRATHTTKHPYGSVVGSRTKKGYYLVRIAGASCYSHRIVWELHNGTIPEGIKIDHKDCDKENNKIDNLRLATESNNKWNLGKYRSNTSGYKGVYWDSHAKRYRASVQVFGKKSYIGVYSTKEEAHAAAEAKRAVLHKEFARS